MNAILRHGETGEPPKPHAICPKCGREPERRFERTERGITRGTYSHGSAHIWIVEWAA